MVDELPIGALQPIKPGGQEAAKTAGADKVSGPSFSDVLKESLKEVNDLQQDAQEKIKGLYTGEIKDLHQVMVAVEDADVAFRLTMQIRNKLTEAFQELMRMQI